MGIRPLSRASLALVACALAALAPAGCFHGAETLEVEGSGEWTHWTIAKTGHFGAFTDLIFVNAILPRTAREPWTAVGHTVDIDGERHPKVWTSSDGSSWETTDLPTDEAWDRVAFATRHGDSVVVAGIRGKQGEGGAVSWLRAADGSWTRTADGVGRLPNIGGTAPSPGGVAIAGSRFGPPGTSALGLARSADGARWTTSFEPGLNARTGHVVDAYGYASTGAREVIVGVEGPRSPQPIVEGRIWWSSGGRWSRASSSPDSTPGAAYTQTVNDVVAFRGGFVAVGTGAVPVAATSPDGRIWRWETMVDPHGDPLEVEVVGDTVVAAGVRDGRLFLWTSYVQSGRRYWVPFSPPAELTTLSAVRSVSLAGGPGGEIAIAVHDENESEIYIGRP